MRLSNCNCGKKVNCGCTVSFDSYQASSVSVLSVGNLVGGSCTFDAYVIDWYVNGQRLLVSGSGNDPEIQAQHPFEGSAAIPVVGGVWVPQLRYVVIDGTRIYSGKRKCNNWCDSMGSLPSINVSTIGCGMRNLATNSLYDYRLSYTTNQDFSLAARTVRFELSSDLSAQYFAFQFTGSDVADQVEIFFKDSDVTLANWIVGTRGVTNWWQSLPYRRAASSHKLVFRIPDYQVGDYLTIRITPSVLETNYNTQWTLDMKCLNSNFVFACDYFSLAHKTINSIELIHDVQNCRYQFRLQLQTPAGNYSSASHPFYWMVQYGGYSGLGHSGGAIDHVNGIATINMSYSKTLNAITRTIAGYSSWEAPYGEITTSKNGNTATFVFSDSRDYDLYLANYQYLQTTDIFTDYSSDPTSMKHYRWVTINNRIAPLGCGDTYTSKTLRFHISSPVVFSGGNTMSITMLNVVNEYPDEPCNTGRAQIEAQISSVNAAINQADFSGVSYCRPVAPVGYATGFNTVLNNPVTDGLGGNSVSVYSKYTTPCEETPFFCDWTSPNSFWLFTFFYVRVIITAARDINNNYIEDPLDNFEVRSRLTANGCYSNTDQRILYKKVNGVVITNILPAY